MPDGSLIHKGSICSFLIFLLVCFVGRSPSSSLRLNMCRNNVRRGTSYFLTASTGVTSSVTTASTAAPMVSGVYLCVPLRIIVYVIEFLCQFYEGFNFFGVYLCVPLQIIAYIIELLLLSPLFYHHSCGIPLSNSEFL